MKVAFFVIKFITIFFVCAGLEPNCEKYHAIGVRESHTYLIDPDGTGETNEKTATVYLVFKYHINPFAGN